MQAGPTGDDSSAEELSNGAASAGSSSNSQESIDGGDPPNGSNQGTELKKFMKKRGAEDVSSAESSVSDGDPLEKKRKRPRLR